MRYSLLETRLFDWQSNYRTFKNPFQERKFSGYMLINDRKYAKYFHPTSSPFLDVLK